MKILRSHTTPSFERDFLSLPEKIQNKAKRKVLLFEDNCFLATLKTHKLNGVLNKLWSFSIDDKHRVIFEFLPNKEVIYYRVGLHKIYEELERYFGK